jgi:recombination endonuclease VII
VRATDRRRLARYGLSPEDWLEILAMTDNRCPICLKPFTAARPPVVDHDHGGPTRGALCGPDNYELTMDRSDPARYERIAAYLRSPPASRLPGPPRRHRDAPPSP